MKTSEMPYSVAGVFICQKCGKRDDGTGTGGDYAEDLKKEFKSRMKEIGRGKEIRVMTSGCLGVCPKERQVIAYCPVKGSTEMMEFTRGEKDEVWKWLKEK